MKLTAEHYLHHFKQLKTTFIGNHLPWLSQTREASLARFLSAGFPDRGQENWKYTDLSCLAKQMFEWAPSAEPLTLKLNTSHQLENRASHLIVFIDGHFCAPLSQLNKLPTGVTLMPLGEALQRQPELMKSYFTTHLAPLPSALTDLNTAFITDGVFLQVAKHTHLELPIHLLFLSTPGNNKLVNNRNILLLEENSQATLVEQHAELANTASPSGHSAKNLFTTITIQQGAHLQYYKLQQEGATTVHLADTTIWQARDSQLTSHSISLGARLARDNLHIRLNDTGAACELNGFYALSDHQHIDHHTRVDHFQPHGSSKECYKGVLKDHAKGVFNGKIIVHPQAQKTRSQQINKNLLLSNTAEMNTKPELEIYTDDVQCAHGATVGQIEADALFYLRSRGMDKLAAMSLLVHAFCEEVLNRMHQQPIADYIKKTVKEKLTQMM